MEFRAISGVPKLEKGSDSRAEATIFPENLSDFSCYGTISILFESRIGPRRTKGIAVEEPI